LYISENYFSFYSNVFGYITKIVIPIPTVEAITREKTAKFFPNAIALQLSDGGKHIFGSFLSRENAYLLMSSIHKKTQLNIEPTEDGTEEMVAEEENDDGLAVEVSSIEDSSSISGSENAQPTLIPVAQVAEVAEDEIIPPPDEITETTHMPTQIDSVAKVGKYEVKLMSEFNVLTIGIVLTVVLAIFSALLLMKINAIEKPSATLHNVISKKLTIEDAESILNKNVHIVRQVRQQLENLQSILEKMPMAMNEKQEF
jgi:hypothetical protein